MKKLIQKLFKKKAVKPALPKERVNIIIFAQNRYESERYFKLFHFMLRDRVIKSLNRPHQQEIHTDEFYIRFLRAGDMARGNRAHFVINMVQDEEFNALVARPIERQPSSYLKDPKWKDLF